MECANGCGRDRAGFDNYCKTCRAHITQSNEKPRKHRDGHLTVVSVVAQRAPWTRRRDLRATVWRYALNWEN